jgi:hypothetical protein
VTDDKNFKRLVRARMAETGQFYTRARDALLAAASAHGNTADTPGVTSPGAELPRDARIFVTGHRGLVGSGPRTAAAGRGAHEHPDGDQGPARPA